ncbi:MAG: pseudouridine synthase [Lachnospiraceae bacterium]|nr:pseudouridine synthase [Lachnospiraceae bacterium]
MKQIRIDKFLAECQAGTRSEVKQKIRKGLVTVNGRIVKVPEQKVSPDQDEIICGGVQMHYVSTEYVMLHKPSGCVTALRDDRYPTVMEYLGSGHRPDLAPVGRLDLDTEGLLILTNDGELAHRMLAPKSHVEKTYFAVIAGAVDEEDVQAFREGLDIGEKHLTLPAGLEILRSGEESEIHLTICEGKFHQVKRMFEARGKKVLYLKRISMGGIPLDPELAAGQWRPLTDDEITKLRQESGMSAVSEETL